MRRIIWFLLFIAVLAGLSVAQTAPAASAQPTRICVALFKNEFHQQIDPIALRDRLAAYLKRGPLVKVNGAEVLALQEDSDETAAPELREKKCDFAVFPRFVVGKVVKADPHQNDPMPTYSAKDEQKKPPSSTFVTGVQFTALRVSTGIPVLIDRVFMDRQFSNDEEVWQLLLVVQMRLETALQKKIAPPKPA